MIHLSKLQGIYLAARALQLATVTDVINPAKQAQAQQSFVDTLAGNLERHLVGFSALPSEFEIMHGVMKLGTV